MTEVEWLAADHKRLMLEHLGSRVSDRKLRLFAIACTRRTAPLWGDSQPLTLLQTAERLADDLTPCVVRRSAFGCGGGSKLHYVYSSVTTTLDRSAADAADQAASYAASSLGRDACAAFPHPTRLRVYAETVRRECAIQAELLRDIFGNPFRALAFNPAWRTSDVVSLARSMYESRDFGVMVVLADALQDAGCEDDTILRHCRCNGRHARGCWIVDLLLDKE